MSAWGIRISVLVRHGMFGEWRDGHTGPVDEAQQEQQRHEEHQLAVELATHGAVFVGSIQLEARDGAPAGTAVD